MRDRSTNDAQIAAFCAGASSVGTACAPVPQNTSTGSRNCQQDSLSTLHPGVFTGGTDQLA
jgi:hypothetical protein